jgi:YD repeat-containing protein
MKRHIAKSLLLFPALLLAFTTFVQAQVSQYSFMYGPSAYTPLSGATALIAPGADNETTALKGIGFVFTFDGTPYTDFSAGSNGFITLGSIISGTGEVNRLKGASLPVIAPLWDNLKVASAAGSGVYYAVQGTAPDRVLVVEWRNMLWDRSASALPGPTISFQLRLRETANTIEFLYHNGAGLVSNTAGASIGLAGIPGPNQGFISVSHALPLPAASHTAEDTTVNTKPVTDIVYSFLPNLPVNPSVEQVTGCVLPGSANQHVLSLNMYNPSQEGALRLTSLTFSIDNTTSAADIDNAKIFGGTGPDFASAVPVGLPVLDPDGIFSFTPDHPLRNGDNYFWLVYDISAGAPADNMIGARLMSYSVNSFTTLAELPSLRPGRVVRLSAAECLLSPPCAEGSRNWVQHTFYNGSGIPVKEARTYSDLLGRVSQVQEKIFSRGNVRAVQTLYDAFGRPVLQTLPAPTESGIFCYKSNFITNSLHNTYSYKDFDEGARVSSPDPVSEASLLGSYYSNSGRESFVGRTAFPYARTEYFPDPLCRIKRISQAGEQLRMGSGHEKKMYYLSSAGEHLYVYGTNGGYIEGSETDAVLRNNSRQLYKTVAIDENGLETVSFTNTSGQTVATCVSGQSSTCTPQKVSSPLGAHGQTSLDIHLPGSKKGTLYIQQPAGSSASSYVIRIYDLNTGAELSSSHYNLSFSSTTLKTKVNFTGSYAGSGSLFLRISYTCTDASQAVCRKVPVLEYELDYSYWTLHYYDQRGRLVRTIQPNGVNCSYDPLVQATYFRTAACTAMAASLPADIYTRNLAARTGFDHTISLSVRAHAAPAGADYCTSSAGPYGGSSSGDLTVLSGQDHIATAAEVIPPDDSPAIQPDPRGDPFLPPLVARLYTIKYRIKYNVYGVISSVRTLLNPRPLEALVDISVYSDNSIAYNTDKGEVFFTIAESQASVYSSFAVNVAEVKVLSDKGAWVPYNASDPLHAYLNAFTVSNSETYTAKLTGSSGFVTTYAYNARNWLVKKVSPDEGTTEYKYDREGKLRFSQNSRQRLEDKFSYTAYDMAGRVMETGEYLQHSGGVYGQFYFDGTAAGSFGPSQAPVSGILEELNGLDAAFCRQRNRIDYDIPSTGLDLGYTQTHLLGKPGRMLSDNSVTWLSYDELGRLKWRGENLPDLGLKTMDYTLDFRGNVIRAAYQKDTPQEALFHHYGYDADERLLDVSTSHSGLAGFTLRSRYLYYLHGPLKRAELGGNLQGVDYVYTINGWLKSINNGARSPARDPGRDGLPAGLKPALFSSDVFGMTLDYFDGLQPYRHPCANLQERDRKPPVCQPLQRTGKGDALGNRCTGRFGDCFCRTEPYVRLQLRCL